MIDILIIDDHAVVRAGMRQIILGCPDMAVIEELFDSRDVILTLRKRKFSVVILDIGLPDKNGIEVLKEIKNEFPLLPVLILSMYPEDQYAIRALRSGAAGYVSKDSAPEELITALRTVATGRKYVSRALAGKLAVHLDVDAKKELHEALSDREYQVLCLIASGRTISEIAEGLCLSVKTVSTYRCRILDKMHLKNNAELINYAIKNRLTD